MKALKRFSAYTGLCSVVTIPPVLTIYSIGLIPWWGTMLAVIATVSLWLTLFDIKVKDFQDESVAPEKTTTTNSKNKF
jgi:hypothetical protein